MIFRTALQQLTTSCGRGAFSLRRHRYSVQSRLSVCLSVCQCSNRKQLELSTPNLVHVYSIAVTRHALTHRSKGQRSRSHSTKSTVARLLVTIPGAAYSCATCGRCRQGSACEYDCLCFIVSSYYYFTLLNNCYPQISIL